MMDNSDHGPIAAGYGCSFGVAPKGPLHPLIGVLGAPRHEVVAGRALPRIQ